MATKKIPAEVEALTIGGQQLLSPEALIENLKSLDNLLVKDTMKQREQIHKLNSNLLSLSADNDILDAIQRDVFRLIISFSLFDATARSTAEKDEIYRDLKRVVEDRDLSRSDLDAKRKELTDLEESIQSLEKALAHTLKDREVADAKYRKLEEKLQSVMFERDLLKRCREDDKHLAYQLVEEVKEMKSQKNVDLQILKAENKANASKISALKEKCHLLEENRGQLEKKVEELNEELENMTRMAAAKNLVDQRNAHYEIQISNLQAEISEIQSARKNLEDAHSSCIQNIAAVQREKNLKAEEAIALNEKCRFLEENSGQLKKKVTKMAAAKNLVDQRNANFEIQISSLQAEILNLQSATKSLEDAHCSCIQNIAVLERERNLKAEEAVDLKMQLNGSMKTKRNMEQKLEVLQKNLNLQTTENEKNKKHINSLMAEKAAQDNKDTMKTPMTAKNDFDMLMKMMAERMNKK